MPTLETLDILFKSSGKSDILKDINDIETKWSNITKNVVENIQKIVELRKELSNVNELTKETVSLVEKELEAKRSVLQEEKNISKARGDINKRIKLALQEEKTEKQREKTEKQREKANRSESIKGLSSSTGGKSWGEWGGLASIASLAGSIMSKTTGSIMSSGDAVLDLMMASAEASTPLKRINPKEMEKLFSRIVDTGLLSIPQSSAILRDLASKYRGGFFRKDIWESLGMAGADIDTTDFLKVFESLAKVAKSGNLSQTQMEGFARINPNLLPILQRLPEFTKSVFPDLEKQLNTRRELQRITNQLESTLAQLGKAFLPTLEGFSKFLDKTLSFNEDISKKIEEISGLKQEWGNAIMLAIEGAIAIGIVSGVKNGTKKALNNALLTAGGIATASSDFLKKAFKGASIFSLFFTPNKTGGDTWETMTPQMRKSLEYSRLNSYRGITLPPTPPITPTLVSTGFDPSGDIIKGKDININLSVPQDATAGIYKTVTTIDQNGNVTTNELITGF